MRSAAPLIRNRLDGLGVVLSALCAVHCVLGFALVAVLGLGSSIFLAPEIHEVGLALAVVIGILTIGLSALRHGRTGPLLVGSLGIALMAAALLVGHGLAEGVLTVAGVVLVAFAHIRNLRHAA